MSSEEPSQPERPLYGSPIPAQSRSGRRGFGVATLVALALTVGATGGGALGTIAASQWLVNDPAPPAVVTGQPVSNTGNSAQTANVATAVYESVGRSVVTITVSGSIGRGLTPTGSGSGFVVDASGLILTNYHVIANARTISVRFYDGTTREAEVLGTDRGNDLALLKVDLPAGIPPAPLGNSDEVVVGETAIAIGGPFGLEQTVTQGIISAVKRDWQPSNSRLRHNLIQTDAPINPGNSGGPLLNARGEVIGINSMIESPISGSVGVGFAVPINTAKQLLPQLAEGAQLEPAWLGITGVALDAAIARDQGLSVQEGVLVTSVAPNSPAAKAGLRGGQGLNETIPRGGDVITAIDGEPVHDIRELAGKLTEYQPGDTVELTITRNNQQMKLNVTLEAWPQGA